VADKEGLLCPNCDGDWFMLARDGAIVCATCGERFTVDGKPTQWHTSEFVRDLATRKVHA
jgi:uncharacterized Zn finger protein (UPF0148 family)